MRESGYYPPGAEFDPDAPYNRPEVPEREFERHYIFTVEKDCRVFTGDYVPEETWSGDAEADTSDTDWMAAYAGSCHSIPALLGLLRSYLEKDMEQYPRDSRKWKRYHELCEECEGWEVTDSGCDEV